MKKNNLKTDQDRKSQLKRFLNYDNTVKPYKNLKRATPYEILDEYFKQKLQTTCQNLTDKEQFYLISTKRKIYNNMDVGAANIKHKRSKKSLRKIVYFSIIKNRANETNGVTTKGFPIIKAKLSKSIRK